LEVKVYVNMQHMWENTALWSGLRWLQSDRRDELSSNGRKLLSKNPRWESRSLNLSKNYQPFRKPKNSLPYWQK